MSAPNSDIVSITISVTSGDLVTLWAPSWREDGEEWQAFLGDDDAVFAFPDLDQLTAFVRTASGHDLADHPVWPIVRRLCADELRPEANQHYDLVGAPEIVANDPDKWAVGELAEIVRITRSLADTCELPVVDDVLGSVAGFGMLDQGMSAFRGREGRRRWDELGATIAGRWDEVLDAIDSLIRTPAVDPDALASARAELGLPPGDDRAATTPAPTGTGTEIGTESGTAIGADEVRSAEDPDAPESAPPNPGDPEFWDEVGIDPIMISTAEGDHFTLRCYLDDRPVFLGSAGRIDTFPSARALTRHLAGAADGSPGGSPGAPNDLARASTWADVLAAAGAGELVVTVHPENTYRLTGLGEDLAGGPVAVDPHQLDLGVELLLDVGDWAGDSRAKDALGPSESLGWLTSFVLRPDPTRLAPSPPFEAEAGQWDALVDALVRRLRHP